MINLFKTKIILYALIDSGGRIVFSGNKTDCEYSWLLSNYSKEYKLIQLTGYY